jgi:CheY-like chemotaxis protein
MCRCNLKKLKPKILSLKNKIIVVDDDPLIRLSTINLLKSTMLNFKSNYEIIEGNDGIDIIDIVSDETDNLIKLIVTDENMANIPGSVAIRAISLIKTNNNIPVVSITAIEDKIGLKNIIDSGADMVLKKPVSRKNMEEIFLNFNL